MPESLQQRKAAFIVVAGLVGGFGAWVWAMTVGPSPLLDSPVVAIPAYMFLGGIAGFLGVYLIAKTDPAQTAHAIAFSLACGIFWGPVISGAEAVVNRAQVEQLSEQVAEDRATLQQAKQAFAEEARKLQLDLGAARRRADELERIRQALQAQVSRANPQGGQAIVEQLDRLDTARLRGQLDASATRIAQIDREVESIRTTPVRPPVSRRDD